MWRRSCMCHFQGAQDVCEGWTERSSAQQRSGLKKHVVKYMPVLFSVGARFTLGRGRFSQEPQRPAQCIPAVPESRWPAAVGNAHIASGGQRRLLGPPRARGRGSPFCKHAARGDPGTSPQ